MLPTHTREMEREIPRRETHQVRLSTPEQEKGKNKITPPPRDTDTIISSI